MGELQKRLREEAATWDEPRSNDETDMRGMLHKAADELDRLTAENSHLRAKLELTPENVVAAVERELAMTAIANCEASSEWIDGFEFAGKRATAAIKALGDE